MANRADVVVVDRVDKKVVVTHVPNDSSTSLWHYLLLVFIYAANHSVKFLVT